MNSKKVISVTMCVTLVFIAGLCVISYANNELQTNAESEQYFEKANELRKKADYEAAITEYNKVISTLPKSRIAQDAQYWIAQSYLEMKQFDTSLSEFKKLLDGYPDSPIVSSTKLMIERIQQTKKNRSLFEAVKKGDIEQVKFLLAEGADINAKWGPTRTKEEQENVRPDSFAIYFNDTPLYHAVLSKNMDMVKFLVEAGADVNAGSWPPLGLAVNIKEKAIVEYLINHGANVNYPEEWGPLHEASTFSIELVKLLVEKGADVNLGHYQPAIHAGIRSGRREIVEFLIQHGADLNVKDSWGRGNTPLQRAALAGETEILKLLLEAGANINAKNGKGQFVLHTQPADLDIVKLLLEKGADINAKDDEGQTMLHLSLDIRNPKFSPRNPRNLLSKDTIELLLSKGADVNLKDKNGRTPLHLAAEWVDANIVKLLLDKGAKVDEKDEESGSTALHYAARLSNKEAAEVLIANGADINAKDKEGHTPLYAAINHDYKFAEFLIEKGADSTIKTESGKTLIQLAQERKQVEATVPDLIFDGEPNSAFAISIDGDVDGDGYDDILIRKPKYDNNRGRVYLFYGGSNVNNKAGLIFEGQNEGDLFGYGISCGDIDKDGYDDIIVTANRGEFPGRVYLFWGSDRNSMDANPDKIFDEQVKKNVQVCVPYVYDIDNDGYDDIILGTGTFSSIHASQVYLYYGNTKELMDTTADLKLSVEKTGERLYTISCGDIDNDGYGDIVIGTLPAAEAADKGVWDKSLRDSSAIAQSSKGRTYLYYGNSKSNMDAKADIVFEVKSNLHIMANSNGYDNVIIGADDYNDRQGRVYLFHGNTKNKMDANPDIILDGEVARSDYGIKVVSGDIDGDGLNDLIVGACGFRKWTGRVYLYWGKDLAGPDPKPGRIFTGEQPNSIFGFGLACGDINNDGFDDLVISAYPFKKDGVQQGRVYLYYGGPK